MNDIHRCIENTAKLFSSLSDYFGEIGPRSSLRGLAEKNGSDRLPQGVHPISLIRLKARCEGLTF